VRDVLGSEAKRVIASVVEAACPLCKVELRIDGERACCPCSGDSYKVVLVVWRLDRARRTCAVV